MLCKKLTLAVAAFGGLVLTAGAVAAEDGESNRLVKNSYQQTADILCAVDQTDCAVQFPPMTDTKTVITGVSCSVFVTPGSFVGFVLSDFGTVTGAFLPAFVFNQGNVNGTLQAATNAATNLFFAKGEQAAVIAVVSNGGQFAAVNGMRCTISGYHS